MNYKDFINAVCILLLVTTSVQAKESPKPTQSQTKSHPNALKITFQRLGDGKLMLTTLGFTAVVPGVTAPLLVEGSALTGIGQAAISLAQGIALWLGEVGSICATPFIIVAVAGGGAWILEYPSATEGLRGDPIYRTIPDLILPVMRTGLLANPDPTIRAWGQHILEKAPDSFIPNQFYLNTFNPESPDAIKLIKIAAGMGLLEPALLGDGQKRETAREKIRDLVRDNETAREIIEQIYGLDNDAENLGNKPGQIQHVEEIPQSSTEESLNPWNGIFKNIIGFKMQKCPKVTNPIVEPVEEGLTPTELEASAPPIDSNRMQLIRFALEGNPKFNYLFREFGPLP